LRKKNLQQAKHIARETPRNLDPKVCPESNHSVKSTTTIALHTALAALRQASGDGERSTGILEAIRLIQAALMSDKSTQNQARVRPRVVIADDEELMRNTLARALSQSYDVVACEDGASAWEAICADPPDAVLLDVNMPGLTGVEVIERIRNSAVFGTIPIVMVTGRTSERHVSRGLATGADDYLVKPFRPKELRARLSRLLQRDAERSALARVNEQLSGQAERASELLHDMGNVLSSVGVSAASLRSSHASKHVDGVARAGALLNTQALASLNSDPSSKATALPRYLQSLANAMTADQQRQQEEARTLLLRVNALKRLLHRAREQAGGRAQDVDVAEAVEEVMVLSSIIVEQAGASIVCDAEHARVLVDAEALQQVLVNLVQNAVDAVSSLPNRAIFMSSEQRGEWVLIRIQDTGSGMDSVTQARLFERGFSTKPGDRGLGLSSCARIVAGMNGTLEASSAGPGLGACFTLTLPLLDS
jgi:DNA-binding response OmpR family regulator